MKPGIRDLIRGYSDSLEALGKAEFIRSKNNPIGDYAEWLVAKAMGLELCTKSTKGYDAFDANHRYEIKSRRITTDNGSRQLSAIRSLDSKQFDYLVGVLFHADFSVNRVAVIPITIVQTHSKYKKHTNAAVFYLLDSVWSLPGVGDITNEVKRIESSL